ncbi:MAG: hypothetical protein DMG57_32810 [Acidobacteria bacterium]|nr:MAG: hypothetical protein DMG57_32810 [Acidobacteriota bacterium]
MSVAAIFTEGSMSSVSIYSKLAELRAKTDQELVNLIDEELNLGFRVALTAPVTAAKAYTEAQKLTHKVEDPGERRRLESKLSQLRETLDGLSAPDILRVFAACS